MPSIAGHGFSWWSLAAFGLAALAALAAGARFTRIDAWYEALEKPPWTPPGWVIALAWWTVFALLAVAMAVVWDAAPRDGVTYAAAAVLAVNLVLNAGWSFLFFTRQNPAAALAELVVLWLSVLALMVVAYAKAPPAAVLLAPYLAWVTFAGFLNYRIVALNP